MYRNLIHHLASSSFCSYAQKNCYTTSFTHDITINGLWFTTLGGNYLWLVCLQLNLCHARHTIKRTGNLHAGSLFLSIHTIKSIHFCEVFSRSMSSCPALQCFLKPLGYKRQIFRTAPILQLAENVIASMTHIQAFQSQTSYACLRPPRTHASSSPFDNIGRRRWSLKTMSADIPSIPRRYHSKSES